MKNFAKAKNKFYFCTRKREIGLWCNGNTTDSGPVIPGSNPGSPTRRRLFQVVFFCVVLPGFVQLVAPRQTCLRCWSVGVLLRNHKPCADSLKVNEFPFCLSAQRLQLRCPPPLSICSVCSRLLPPVEIPRIKGVRGFAGLIGNIGIIGIIG